MDGRQGHDPLYGDRPIGELRMVVQCKAMVEGRRHLVRAHRLPVSAIADADAGQLMDLHFEAHGFDPIPTYGAESLPWSIAWRPHRVLEARSQPVTHGEVDDVREP